MFKTTYSVALAAAALALGPAALAQNGPAGASITSGNSGQNAAGQNGNLSRQDMMFVRKAAIGGMAEVREGRLASERAARDAVRDFGQHMVQDHTNANNQLMQIVSQKGITPPAGLDAKHASAIRKLERERGATFDRTYVPGEVKDHRETIALFEREAQNGQDPDLRNFAQQTLPTLREHLHMILAIRSGNAAFHRTSGSR